MQDGSGGGTGADGRNAGHGGLRRLPGRQRRRPRATHGLRGKDPGRRKGEADTGIILAIPFAEVL